MFAATDFKHVETILRFSGALIDFAAMLRKGVNQANPLQISANRYIDLEAPGVYANHSCDPNAGIRNDTDLVAIQPIRRGEEIRYDYSTTMWEDHWTLICHCGSNQFRGLVADFPTLPEIQ
ncbi:MAG: SET domain-containing protein-lysine N-methyltransferase, partial [Pirellulaceae bacterium]